MKKSYRLLIGMGALALGVLALSACTANFCTNKEKARMLYEIDPGISVYATKDEALARHELDSHVIAEQVFPENPGLYRYIPVNEDGETPKFSTALMSVRVNVSNNANYIPWTDYFKALDTKVLEYATDYAISKGGPYSYETMTPENAVEILDKYGYLKFYSSDPQAPDTLWTNYHQINAVLRMELGDERVPTREFETAYMNELNKEINLLRSCIATVTGEYGSYGDDNRPILIEAKSWGDAWSRGPIEGLLVYPVAWLVDTITIGFGGVSANGWVQLAALFLVTLIVRLFIFACTFKTVFSQKKMQALQPELAKLQMKYPNSNTNQAEKQRLAQEQMALYKKHKINPLSQLLVLLIQFPIFIAVWGAMTGSSVLSTGSLLGLGLSKSISNALFNIAGWPNSPGWWTGLVLFILMGVAQFISMKLPQWIQKARTKKIARLGKNPAADKQQKTMQMVSYFMLVMIIFMGFTLPAAMGIYWFFGALISMLQTVITQFAGNERKKKPKKPHFAVKGR